MSVTFKFRSSAAAEAVDLPRGRSSISVRELRAEIMRKKNLKPCQDFHLVLSDSLTGKVLEDDDLELPEGSSVIVKRAPGWVPGSLRSSKLPSTAKLQNADERIPHGNANVESKLPPKSEPKAEMYTQLERVFPSEHPASEAAHFPPELKCFICAKFMKEAVMVKCCQQSFCGECIRTALAEGGKCPMCLSTETRVSDLLPNLSLRNTIRAFLNRQTVVIGSKRGQHLDIPDVECRVDSTNAVQTRYMRCKPKFFEDATEIHDENMASTFPEWRKQGPKTYQQHPRRPKRGDRTCYMCGSPDHLIRDCPFAAPRHQYGNGLMPGHPPPNWHVAGRPPAPSYASMHPGYGMMTHNTTMAPVTNFGPPCPPFVRGSFPVTRAWANSDFNQAAQGVGGSGYNINDRKRVHDGEPMCSNNIWTDINKRYKNESCSQLRPRDVEPVHRGFQNLKSSDRFQRAGK